MPKKVKITIVLNRVLKKLSAIRKTMPKDERAVLDMLVTGESAEVSGHALSIPLAAKKGDLIAAKKSDLITAKKSDVSGHAWGVDLGAKKGDLVSAKKSDLIAAKKDNLSAKSDVLGHAWGVDLTAKKDLTAKIAAKKDLTAKSDVLGHAVQPGAKIIMLPHIVYDPVSAKYIVFV